MLLGMGYVFPDRIVALVYEGIIIRSSILLYFLSHESRANQQLSSCVAQHLFMPG
jgi:hypothetical protein